jgi:hypothetical protein
LLTLLFALSAVPAAASHGSDAAGEADSIVHLTAYSSSSVSIAQSGVHQQSAMARQLLWRQPPCSTSVTATAAAAAAAAAVCFACLLHPHYMPEVGQFLGLSNSGACSIITTRHGTSNSGTTTIAKGLAIAAAALTPPRLIENKRRSFAAAATHQQVL